MESKKIIENWYTTTLYEISNGESLADIKWVLKDFELDEAYEECAGIKKALDFSKDKTMKDIRGEYKQLIEIENGK